MMAHIEGLTMRPNRLLTAITASGALLWLNVSADGHLPPVGAPSATGNAPEVRLVGRVERLREKLLSSADIRAAKPDERIEKLVQFFNCFRLGWRNC
jgi:hypothetical protein